MPAGNLFFAIIDRGKANRLLHRAQEIGAQGGTILLGEGTMPSRFLDILGINQTQKEVLLMAVQDEITDSLFEMLKQEFKLHKRYKGIAFCVPFRQYVPESPGPTNQGFPRGGDSPYVCLMTVVDRGLGVACMDKARAAGARGGTIMQAHGAGVPKDFYFPLIIEPQKDIVLIVAKREQAAAIRDAIYTQMELENKSRGIIFGLPVRRSIGLYEERQADREAPR